MTALRARPAPLDRPAGRGGGRARVWSLLVSGLAAVLVAGLLVRFATAGDPAPAPAAASAPVRAVGAAAAVTAAQDRLRAAPDDAAAAVDLGVAYLARARESADASYYTLADQALARAAELLPDDLRVLVGQGLLALSRHEFSSALALGQTAVAGYPDSAEALGVVVDAQVELGRYPEALESAQLMVDLRPDIAALSRVSYLRELHGDPDGAIAAMTQARTAGSGSPADVAYVGLLLGDLLRAHDRLPEAQRAYESALEAVPGYLPVTVGLARLAVARGDLPSAEVGLRTAVTALPLPENVAFYGDVLAELGRPAEAAAQYALVGSIEQLQRAGGVVVDLEGARYAADHARDPGASPEAAVALAREALANRPTVYGHDALAWALRQAGQPALALPEADLALALGTQDAMLHVHRAAIRLDLGDRAGATADLTRAFEISPAVMSASSLSSLRDLAVARDLAAALEVPVPSSA